MRLLTKMIVSKNVLKSPFMNKYQNDSLFDFDELDGFSITSMSMVKAENRKVVYSITEYGRNLKSILFE